MSPEVFRTVCQQILGSEWHRAVARELGRYHPDGPRPQIDDRLVRRWAAGERPIPPWVALALARIADEACARHIAAAKRLRVVSQLLVPDAASTSQSSVSAVDA